MKTEQWLETYFCKDCDCVYYLLWSMYGAEQLNECPCCDKPGRNMSNMIDEMEYRHAH
jgi:hypothetical protein